MLRAGSVRIVADPAAAGGRVRVIDANLSVLVDTGRACCRIAGIVQRLNRYARLRAFARFAGAGGVGLLAVTLTALAAPLLAIHQALLIGSLLVFVAERAGLFPVILLALAVAFGSGSVVIF